MKVANRVWYHNVPYRMVERFMTFHFFIVNQGTTSTMLMVGSLGFSDLGHQPYKYLTLQVTCHDATGDVAKAATIRFRFGLVTLLGKPQPVPNGQYSVASTP